MKNLISLAAILGIGGTLLGGAISMGSTALENINSGVVYEATGDVIDKAIYGTMDLLRGESVDFFSVTDGIGDIASAIFSSDSSNNYSGNGTIRGTRVNGFSNSTTSKTIDGFH